VPTKGSAYGLLCCNNNISAEASRFNNSKHNLFLSFSVCFPYFFPLDLSRWRCSRCKIYPPSSILSSKQAKFNFVSEYLSIFSQKLHVIFNTSVFFITSIQDYLFLFPASFTDRNVKLIGENRLESYFLCWLLFLQSNIVLSLTIHVIAAYGNYLHYKSVCYKSSCVFYW